MTGELNLFAPICKVDPVKMEVTGVIAEEAPDHTKEIFDYETGKSAVSDWSESARKRSDGKSLGNVRAMHGNIAAGKLLDVQFDDTQKKIFVTSKIVDRAEFEKCEQGVYTGFSIGGSYARKWDDPALKGHTRYTPRLAEVSLVDNPCMYGATFTSIKSDGSEEIRKFVGTPADDLAKEVKTKRVAGEDLTSSAFAYVGDKSDTSTWKLPIKFSTDAKTKSHIRNALARFDQTEGIPSGEKPKVRARIAAAAHKHGIDADKGVLASDLEKIQSKTLPPFDCGAGHLHVTKRAAEGCIDEQSETLIKGMWHIGPLAEALAQIAYLGDVMKFEADVEEDGSEIPDKLKAVAKELAGILVDLTEEESTELIATAKGVFLMATEDLSKAGSPHKKQAAFHAAMAKHHEMQGSAHEKMADQHAKMADHFAGLHEKETGKALTADELGKSVAKVDPVAEPVAKLEGSDALVKALNSIAERLDQQDQVNKAMAETLKKISDAPAAVPARVIAISKAEDGAEPVKKDDEPKTPQDAIRKLHASGAR